MRAIDELRKAARKDVHLHTKFASEYQKYVVYIEQSEFDDMIDAIERELEEEYVPLPKDADGVPIHLLDHLKVDGAIGVFVVGNMTCCTDGWLVGTNRGQIGRPEKDAHHYKPPTVEDVLREFALKCEDAGYAGPEVEEIASEFAERLRLREDDE